MMKNRYLIAGLCAVLAALVMNLGTAYAQSDTLRVAFTTDARTLDPATVTRDYTG